MAENEITMQQAIDMRKDAVKLATAIFPDSGSEVILSIAKKLENYFRTGKASD